MARIRVLKCGECKVKGDLAFHGGDPAELFDFYLYIWLVECEGGPVIVDTGPKDLEEFNRMVASYIPGGVKQAPEERPERLLETAGVDPSAVPFVTLTHTHYDHASNLDLFPRAKVVLTKRALEAAQGPLDSYSKGWRERLLVVRDFEEFLPGVSLFWIGGHSPCSQAISVETRRGRAVICGDTVFLYRNIEEMRPIGGAYSIEECMEAMSRIREVAEIVLPGHDPNILRRFPGGIVG